MVNVSSGMMSDYKMRCRMITDCCKKLMKKLSKENANIYVVTKL